MSSGGHATQDDAQKGWHVQPVAAPHQQVMLANYEHAGLRLRRARSDPFPLELHGTWHVAHAFSLLLSRDHAVSRRGREMRASILDQPPIAVAGGHVDKVDRYHGDDRSIRTVNIAYSKERVDN